MKKNNRCLKIFHFMRNENRKKEKDYFFFLRYILYETEKNFCYETLYISWKKSHSNIITLDIYYKMTSKKCSIDAFS